jgi:hypothetical protein
MTSDVPNTGQLTLRVNFEAAETLNTEAQLVAYDAAGNPSDPSAPFVIKFDGCTQKLFSEECATDEDEGLSCAVDPRAGSSTPWLGAGMAMAMAAMLLRRR